ncbi:MAG: adenylyltransferase/cytidyltransferase family protein [Candidatus Sumerlaeia bacterium]
MERVFHDMEKLAALICEMQDRGQKVVLANGCFDVVHGGHVSYLEDARACGDVLVVGVNSDASVRKLKGANRPVCREQDRLDVLAEMKCVDYLIVFDEESCERLLRTLRPNVHAKGTDYTADTVPERLVSDELGIETVITGMPKENATKTMIRKVSDSN